MSVIQSQSTRSHSYCAAVATATQLSFSLRCLCAGLSPRLAAAAAATAIGKNGVPFIDPSVAPTSAANATAAPKKSMLREGLELAACTAAIYLCFLGYGYLHEIIYKRSYGPQKEKFTHSLFLVCCQSIGNCAFSLLRQATTPKLSDELMAVMKQPKNTVPFMDYIKIAFSYIGAMYSSNLALNYMSYPAQSLAKSCKMVPVMLMRIVVVGQRYQLHEYVQVLVITAGICSFMLFEDGAKSGKETSLIGFGLCLVSLLLDGFTGPTQERINAQHRPSMAQMMFFLNFWAILLVLTLLLLTGQLWTGLHFFAKYPEVLPEVAVFSLLSALGQAAILVTVLNFNSLILTTITTTRKFFTILFSVFIHGHHLNNVQWGAVLMVFAGLGFEVYEKYQARKHKAHKQKHAA